MLTLQFKIEASTMSTSTIAGHAGRSAQACLEPFAAAAAAAAAAAPTTTTTTSSGQQQQQPNSSSSLSSSDNKYQQDEKVLVALQHSLFCAKLFESIRRELAADTEVLGATTSTNTSLSMSSSSATTTTTTTTTAHHDSKSLAVWLSSDGQGTTNFLPAPHFMIRGGGGGGDGDANDSTDDGASITKASQPLAVIHCHEVRWLTMLACFFYLLSSLLLVGILIFRVERLPHSLLLLNSFFIREKLWSSWIVNIHYELS